MSIYKSNEVEQEILDFWKNNKILEKLRQKNKKGKPFYFLQGPPYTSGRIHIGTAWNQILKDQILRYKRFQGLDVWDRSGYDMHGLPTANKVQQKLKLKYKKDIETYGIDKFVTECKNFSIEMMNVMNEDFKKLGVWLDHDNAYMPIKNEYIEGVWFLIKQAYDKKRMYQDKKTMTWCSHCETGLAKHELEYENVKDKSIFVKFKLEDSDEYLVIWTTTPWTIAYNLGIMAHPDFEYVKAKVGNEIWILAKELVDSVIKEKYKIIKTIKGKDLKGLHYIHPFYNELKYHYDKIKAKSKNAFSVVLSKEYVDLSTGSGLVHMAPGCGPEDYEVGRANGIPAFNNLKENGNYPEDMGKFSGLNAKKDNEEFIKFLDNLSALISTSTIEHDYAHCWRCHNPVIFRATTQWFFKVEDLVPKMIEENESVNWVPKVTSDRYKLWIENLKDNSITRQRYWGTPMPLWQCKKCKDITIIGSIDELKKYTKEVPKDLHRPWIDKVEFKCKCGSTKKRTKDILDVWIDSGTASWNCLHYPSNKDLLKKYYPADLILEATEQTRLWFYMLHLASKLAFDNHCYKNVYVHGMLRGVGGVKMSKSLGNIISPNEVIEKYGVDTLRSYVCTVSPGEDMNFTWEDIKLKQRNLVVLWNTMNYLIGYYNESNILLPSELELEDKFILSKLNSTIKEVTEALENYELAKSTKLSEELFLSLSRDYIKMVRHRSEDKRVFQVIFNVLLESVKMFSLTCPFISEKIYQELKNKFNLKEESIFNESWPKVNKKLIDTKLEKSFGSYQEVLQEILAQREKAQLGIRWPLASALISSEEDLSQFEELFKVQTNIKKIMFKKGPLEVKLDTQLTKELEQEGFSREIIRHIQSLRKKEGLVKEDEIELVIISPIDFRKFKDKISSITGAKSLLFEKNNEYLVESKVKIKEKEFEVYFNKI